jgi:hypothetical protein
MAVTAACAARPWRFLRPRVHKYMARGFSWVSLAQLDGAPPAEARAARGDSDAETARGERTLSALALVCVAQRGHALVPQVPLDSACRILRDAASQSFTSRAHARLAVALARRGLDPDACAAMLTATGSLLTGGLVVQALTRPLPPRDEDRADVDMVVRWECLNVVNAFLTAQGMRKELPRLRGRFGTPLPSSRIRGLRVVRWRKPATPDRMWDVVVDVIYPSSLAGAVAAVARGEALAAGALLGLDWPHLTAQKFEAEYGFPPPHDARGILASFDLTCCAAAFDGNRFEVPPGLADGVFWLTPVGRVHQHAQEHRESERLRYRIAKYVARGLRYLESPPAGTTAVAAGPEDGH